MRKINVTFWGLLGGVSLLWLLATPDLLADPTFRSIRHNLVQYTGVIAIAVMSAAMVLAIRSRWLEAFLDGLDKSYRLHKWLGIAALVAAVAHWLSAKGPKWLVQLGLREPGQHARSAGLDTFGAVEQVFRSQRGTAELIGEWAFYAIVVLIALALIKAFPYRLFARTHKLIAIAYLVLVAHAVVLLDFADWMQPIGLLTAVLMAAGVVSAFLVLFNRVGRDRRISGTIEALEYFPEMRVLETSIRLDLGRWQHEAGQFAFVTFDAREGHHPFTIGSAWDPGDREIVFITKALGDYTTLLPDRLHLGDRVEVEGPYGEFVFDDHHERQIWIGAGIGITPFIARLLQLAGTPHTQQIDLFHTVPVFEQAPLDKLTAKAAAANVRLHIMVDGKDGLLNGERLRQALPDWASAGIWFCGPGGFGTALRRDLIANGLPAKDFHQELFDFR